MEIWGSYKSANEMKKAIDKIVEEIDELNINFWKYNIKGPGGLMDILEDGENLDKLARFYKRKNCSVEFICQLKWYFVLWRGRGLNVGELGKIILENGIVKYSPGRWWSDEARSNEIKAELMRKGLIYKEKK